MHAYLLVYKCSGRIKILRRKPEYIRMDEYGNPAPVRTCIFHSCTCDCQIQGTAGKRVNINFNLWGKFHPCTPNENGRLPHLSHFARGARVTKPPPTSWLHPCNIYAKRFNSFHGLILFRNLIVAEFAGFQIIP